MIQNIKLLDQDNEIKDLKHEIINLKDHIVHQDNEIKDLKDHIVYQDNEIKDLKQENKELKLEITNLKDHIVRQDNDIKDLKQENKELKLEIKDLKLDNDRIKNISVYEKYLMAIQDLNSLEQLEAKLNYPTNRELNELRRERIHNCHYLDTKYDDDIDDRRIVLYEKLVTIPPQIKAMFDQDYPTVLNAIIPYVVRANTQLSQKSLHRINRWWDR
jgi:chromosome segregation ATPase